MEAKELAKYVIAYNNEYGDLITNKKLQKLLYYIAAWGMVYFEDGIIDDDFVAWVHGPVCVSVYHEYKDFGYMPLELDDKDKSASDYIRCFIKSHHNVTHINDKIELINAVIQKYVQFSSLQLELLTHSEKPWKEARLGLQPIEKGTSIIKKSTMLHYYKSLLDAEH